MPRYIVGGFLAEVGKNGYQRAWYLETTVKCAVFWKNMENSTKCHMVHHDSCFFSHGDVFVSPNARTSSNTDHIRSPCIWSKFNIEASTIGFGNVWNMIFWTWTQFLVCHVKNIRRVEADMKFHRMVIYRDPGLSIFKSLATQKLALPSGKSQESAWWPNLTHRSFKAMAQQPASRETADFSQLCKALNLPDAEKVAWETQTLG